MAYFNNGPIKRLISRKYSLIDQSSTNIFLSNDVKDRIRDIFQKTQRTYLALARFANIVRHKIGKEKIETDLRMESIDIHSKYSMCIYHSGSKYLFVLSDLVNIIQTAITHSHNFFPNPLRPKNPFNNLPFTPANLYNIYFRIKSAFTTVPQWIHLFFLNEFSLDAFVLDNEQILREQYIKNYVNNSSIDVLYDEFNEMFLLYRRVFISVNIHEDFPRRDLMQIFRPYIYLYIISQNAIKGTDKRRLAAIILKKKLEEFIVYNPLFGRKSVSIKYIPNSNEETLKDNREPAEDDSIGRFAEPLRGVVGVPSELNLESRRDSLANHRFSSATLEGLQGSGLRPGTGESSHREISQENEVMDISQENLFRNHRRRYVSTFIFNNRHPSFTLNDACKSFDKRKILIPSNIRGDLPQNL
jgi:hypothetical protein